MKADMGNIYKTKKLAEGVYALSSGGVQLYLLVGNAYALLFDTGYGFTDWRPSVRRITSLPLYVVNSHGHIDHSGGNVYHQGLVYIHADDLAVYKQHNAPQYRRIGLEGIVRFQKILFWKKFFPAGFDEDAYLHACEASGHNMVGIEEGHVFDLGGCTGEVISLPGHTHGSIGLLCREKKLLFVGDAMNANVWLFLPESCPLAVYQHTLRKAETLDFAYMLAGHSHKLIPKSMLKYYKAAADNPDFAHGKPMAPTDFAPGVEARTCPRSGKNTKDILDATYAAIVISADKF